MSLTLDFGLGDRLGGGDWVDVAEGDVELVPEGLSPGVVMDADAHTEESVVRVEVFEEWVVVEVLLEVRVGTLEL